MALDRLAYPALLIVDMQNDFVRIGAPLEVPQSRETIPVHRRLCVQDWSTFDIRGLIRLVADVNAAVNGLPQGSRFSIEEEVRTALSVGAL